MPMAYLLKEPYSKGVRTLDIKVTAKVMKTLS
jgi:hypothetical protein